MVVVVSLLIIIFLYFVWLSFQSRQQSELGILNGELHACPLTPNCISSEKQGLRSSTEPFIINPSIENASRISWEKAREAVIEMGGEIVTESDGYLHAIFMTPLMRYIDDVELRLDDTQSQIHIRSASRVGHSDFGKNQARINKIRMMYLN